ncbi:peptidase family C78-domain-containing protein [Rhizoctonia solani]|nr:peptidase family C78-domain-containing protein [Rhizoctonia solani]
MSESLVPATNDDDMDYVFCELCREPLQELSLEDRQAHYEGHFNNGDGLEINELDAQLAASIATQASSPGRGAAATATHLSNQRVVAPQKPRENVFWHPVCGLPAPRIATPGIIPILGRALGRPGSKGGALCSPLVTHYGTELWDLGWGCGYRNFLMACSALAAQDVRPEYRELLMDDICGPPGVRNLQVWIEDAWRRGYDTHGAAELRHHLLGTRKWIGTAELYVAFTSRGIPARLVDFPNNGHAHLALIQWLTVHFMEDSNDLSSGPEESHTTPHVYMSTKMPIVLQHKGHSRTVVGIEFTKSGGTNLLIYDPARRPSAAVRKAGLKLYASGVSSISSNTFPHPQQHRHHGSPTKAKDFFKRVIKRRSRSRIDEQVPKRVRGGTAEADDWETLGRGKGHKLGDPTVGDHSHNDPGLSKVTNSSSHADSETKAPEANINLLATLQDLDLGRVLSAFRVTPSQLGKKDQYQILWFPMTSPLTGPERDACKVVRSERVTVSPVPTS